MESAVTLPTNYGFKDQKQAADSPWANAAKHLADRELEIVQQHEQLLKRREALLRTTECYFDFNTRQAKTFVVDVREATARNESLLKSLDERLGELREGHQPSNKLGMLKNNYWAMVKRVFPVWAEELHDHERRKNRASDQRPTNYDRPRSVEQATHAASGSGHHLQDHQRSGSKSVPCGTSSSARRSEEYDSPRRSIENSPQRSPNRSGMRSNNSPPRSGGTQTSRSAESTHRSGGTSDPRSDSGQRSGNKSTPRSNDSTLKSTDKSGQKSKESTQRSIKSSTRRSNNDASPRSALALAPRSIVDMDDRPNYNNNNNKTAKSSRCPDRRAIEQRQPGDSSPTRSPAPHRSLSMSQGRPSSVKQPASSTSPEKRRSMKQLNRSLSVSD